MDNSLSTITDYLAENFGHAVSTAVSYIPDDLSRMIKHASSYFPAQVDLITAAQFMLFFAAGSLILGVLSRVVLGKRSSLNHSLSSAIGILFIYALTIVVYTFKPWNLEALLSPLPFVTFSGEYLIVFPIADAHFPALCSEVLSLIILAFLVNLLDTYFPKGEHVFSWYILRFLTVIISMLLHLIARWAIRTYLPGVLVTRVVLGKRSSLNHSLSSAIGILFIYALTIVVYTFKPWNLEALLSPLPFVTFSGEYLIVFPIADAHFPALCSEVLSLIILAFLVNLLDTYFPKGEHVFSWYILRFLTVIISMLLHLIARWAIRTYLPGVLVTYAPTILLVLLAFLLLSGILNLILGLVITMANPFMGAMYTFFFSNVIGKQLSKAIFSSAILCAVVYLLEFFGYTVICITSAALMAYIPLVILLLVLWFLIGHVL